jgi:predicted transcriptional regulator of viral defense system
LTKSPLWNLNDSILPHFSCICGRKESGEVMNKIIMYIEKNGGYATMKEMKETGFQTRDIKKLVDQKKIEKIKPGLYKIWKVVDDSKMNPSFLDICHANERAVICLSSALEYHGISTINPSIIYAALPRMEKAPKIPYPPVKFYRWKGVMYETGILKIETLSGIVKIYDKEKTVCDMFRYRDKLGEDIAFEALKNYLKLKEADLNKLRNYSEKLRIKTVLKPYIKAIVG